MAYQRTFQYKINRTLCDRCLLIQTLKDKLDRSLTLDAIQSEHLPIRHTLDDSLHRELATAITRPCACFRCQQIVELVYNLEVASSYFDGEPDNTELNTAVSVAKQQIIEARQTPCHCSIIP